MQQKNKQEIKKKERRMPMKSGFSNVSSMPLIDCVFPSSVFITVDDLLLFSSVHSTIHN